MTDRELMQQALDALEGYARNCRCEGGGAPCDAAEALRARLAQSDPYAAQAALVDQQTQGRMYVDPVTGDVGIGSVNPEQEPVVKWDASAPLVVHPHPAFQATLPQPDLAKVGEVGIWGERQWQGLTDEEIDETAWPYFIGNIMPSVKIIVRQLEAKLKEKNHG